MWAVKNDAFFNVIRRSLVMNAWTCKCAVWDFLDGREQCWPDGRSWCQQGLIWM